MLGRSTLLTAAFLLTAALPRGAEAQATLLDGFGGAADYGTACLGMNDDGASNAIDITPYFPAGLRFFDRTHSTIYINTNGNISFSAPVPTFTAQAFPVADQPMIAPYWADVDIRTFDRIRGLMRDCHGPRDGDTTMGAACHSPADNGIWWHVEAGRMVITWDRVSYYKCHSDRDQRMSFQLILTAVDSAACGATGDFDVEFRYNRCEWTTGDASLGSDGSRPTGGFGGTPAQAGFDAGNLMDFVMIAGSRTAEIHNILCSQSNAGDVSTSPELAGIWRFQIRSGIVVCPGAGDECATGSMGVCATGRTQCVADRIECRPELAASDEVCDSLDNDCDGSIDEDDTLCDEFEVCRDGTCIGNCFEGGCPSGYTCTTDGLCVEDLCVGVTCAEGERCESGACVSPCAGIVCPSGLDCVAGRCVDRCADSTCDDCTVCEAGACVARCQTAGCDGGEACRFDGACVPADCIDVTCAAGEHCDGGVCVDSCAGAVCPGSEVCSLGQCVAATLPDGGVPPPRDSGLPPLYDGGPRVDAGRSLDAGPDAGSATEAGGCGCRAAGSNDRGPLALLLFALCAGLLARRRRL